VQGDNQVVLDETSYGQQDIDSFEIKSILQQGGKACLGFGKGGSVKAAMGSAALDSPFMHGWLAVRLILRHFLSHILKAV
jgi:cell division GTPase FtsZ